MAAETRHRTPIDNRRHPMKTTATHPHSILAAFLAVFTLATVLALPAHAREAKPIIVTDLELVGEIEGENISFTLTCNAKNRLVAVEILADYAGLGDARIDDARHSIDVTIGSLDDPEGFEPTQGLAEEHKLSWASPM
jgi:hypothetical protein